MTQLEESQAPMFELQPGISLRPLQGSTTEALAELLRSAPSRIKSQGPPKNEYPIIEYLRFVVDRA